MYIVTFYSFKGGVGRTMSLVNVAAALANAGRRILIVDFDLEAPGIPTFELFSGIADVPGIVDYISDYLSSSRAPDAREYMTRRAVWETPSAGGIWLMPAGRQQASYATRLHAVDWQQLYAQHEGYLLFEDLKAQWQTAIEGGFDYVFLDSRTGHTDVGGICTRQFPDAVVIMFFPNEQNLQGLVKVVADIRAEAASARRKSIKLHFVASNVPDLDDEEDILQRRLVRSQELLSYKQDEALILHHYNSLSLLNQQIFLIDRPKSKLAQEYRALVDAIVTGNLEDPQGAMNSLMKMQLLLSRAPRELSLEKTDVEGELATIARAHHHNSDMLYRIALLRERMGLYQEALAMLNEAEGAGAISPQIFARRAQLNQLLGNPAKALEDAQRAIAAPEISGIDLINLVRVIGDNAARELLHIDEMAAIRVKDDATRLRVAQELMGYLEGVKTAERMLSQILTHPETPENTRGGAKNYLSLSLIAQQRYREAMNLICTGREELFEQSDLSETFNYAMAEWGDTNEPARDLFARVIALNNNRVDGGANYLQCIAICYHFAGNHERAREYVTLSRREIRVNPKRIFDAWRYLEVSPTDFQRDLEELETLIRGNDVVPAFMRRQRATALEELFVTRH